MPQIFAVPEANTQYPADSLSTDELSQLIGAPVPDAPEGEIFIMVVDNR